MYTQLEHNTTKIITSTCDDLIRDVYMSKENINILKNDINNTTNQYHDIKDTIQHIINNNSNNNNSYNTKINEIFQSIDIINNNINNNNNSNTISINSLKDEMVTQFHSINNTFASFDQIQEKIVLNIANINNDINNININIDKNFDNVNKDIQETLSIIEENKTESDAKALSSEQNMVTAQDFKRFEKKMEENISRFLANTAVSMNSSSGSSGAAGVTGNVRKLNDSVVNDSNANTKSSSYKRVTLETDNDDNEDDNSSNTFSQINAKHNALSMFLSEYKNNQDGMLKKLESYAASKYHEGEDDDYRVDDNRTGQT